MNICDKVTSDQSITKDCLRLILKRLNHQDPHVVVQAITVSCTETHLIVFIQITFSIYLQQLLDACVNNCRKPFHLEVASREFENEYKRLLQKSQPKVATVRFPFFQQINVEINFILFYRN